MPKDFETVPQQESIIPIITKQNNSVWAAGALGKDRHNWSI